MEPRISIITLGVADVARSTRFYRDGLGFETAMASEGYAVFRTGGTRLAIYPLDKLAEDVAPGITPAKGFGGITLAHNVRKKDEVASVLQLAEKAGGKIVKTPQDVFWGGYSGYFSDPDGYLWEVAWGPDFKFDDNGALVI
ncbi:MAG: hypothetical protein JWM32_263 [Verrucomicrobia bacterium]|nr:hypothetical protein [Verrucomicrobiota bacterium]